MLGVHGSRSVGSRGQGHAVRPRVVHREIEGAVDPLRAPEEIAVHPGYAAPFGAAAGPAGIEHFRSTHRTARRRCGGFGKRDSVISA